MPRPPRTVGPAETDLSIAFIEFPRGGDPGLQPWGGAAPPKDRKKKEVPGFGALSREPANSFLQPFAADRPRERGLGWRPRCRLPCQGQPVQLPSDGPSYGGP